MRTLEQKLYYKKRKKEREEEEKKTVQNVRNPCYDLYPGTCGLQFLLKCKIFMQNFSSSSNFILSIGWMISSHVKAVISCGLQLNFLIASFFSQSVSNLCGTDLSVGWKIET